LWLTIYFKQALQDILLVWRKGCEYRQARAKMDDCTKRDAKARQEQKLHEFQFAWGQRDLHQVWKTARQLSGKPIGPKRRRYDAAKSAWPEKAEWVAFLQQSGPAGGCSAVELDVDSFEVVEDEASVPVMDCTTARELAKSYLRALRRCARGSTLRKTCPPVFQPKFGGNSFCHSGRWIWLQVVLAFQGKFGNQHCFTAYFTCLCPYDFTTEPLTRGSEATQQLWTNVMANLGLLACASSTTWKFWESGILIVEKGKCCCFAILRFWVHARQV